MAKYYNCGIEGLDIDSLAKAQSVDEEDRIAIKKQLIKHHPLSGPHRDNLVAKDGAVFLKKPPLYCLIDQMTGKPIPEYVPWEAGSVSFGIPGYGFFVVPPGGEVVIDHSIPDKVVKDAAPHLLTEAEYLARFPKVERQKPGPKPQAQ